MSQKKGIDYFGYRLPFAKLHGKTTVRIRRKIYAFLKQELTEVKNKTFLDHGSTPETTREASNCFIRWLMEDGAKVYAVSPENIRHLEQAFPELIVLDWPPNSFSLEGLDCIISSAVIEHVGAEKSQIEYVSSLLQLHPTILLTTPNRYHWLEFHTKIPFLHWLPRNLHRTILSWFGLKFWASEKNLRLLSQEDLNRIVHQAAEMNGLAIHLEWYQPRFWGMVSNLCVLITSL